MKITIVSASDSKYFDLLKGLISSIRRHAEGGDIAISIFDVGLTDEQRKWIEKQRARVVEPGWDFDVPSSMHPPEHLRAILARPFIPRYFPGYDIYFHIDADAWIQDWSVVEIYLNAAKRGLLAITSQIDRSYTTAYKRSKRMGRTENFKSFRWSYGWRRAYRLGRNPILNSGAFAMPADCEHWNLWAKAINLALQRRPLIPRRGWPLVSFKLVEQTALNYVVFHDRAPSTFLPAYCNWFCALAPPKFDRETKLLVEPHAPHQPVGIVHLAGEDYQNRVFDLQTTDGAIITTRLRCEDLNLLAV